MKTSTTLLLTLLCLGCSPRETSHLADDSSPLASAPPPALLVAPGKRAPGVCHLDGEGNVSCLGLKDEGPRYAAMRMGGPYLSLSGNCGVTTQATLLCWDSPVPRGEITFPGGVSRLQVRRMSSGELLCGIGRRDTVEVGFCLRPGQPPHIVTDPSEKPFVAVATAGQRVCFVGTDGGMGCSDLDSPGGSAAGGSLPMVDVAMSNNATCSLWKDGSVSCDRSGLPQEFSREGVVRMEGAGDWICAQHASGDFSCLGKGTETLTRRHMGDATGRVTAFGVGREGICVAWESGTFSCLDPQSGLVESYREPEANFLFAGQRQTCAANNDGSSFCWGPAGDLNLPQDTFYINGKELALGKNHWCLATPQGLRCRSAQGEMEIPAALRGQFVSVVAAFEDATCALAPDGRPYCFGSPALEVPPQITGARDLAVGSAHACALLASGAVTCWGDNTFGQSQPPSTLLSAANITAGAFHTCAIDREGKAVCFGKNAYGESQPPTYERFRQLSAGRNDTCGVTTAGQVHCWGEGKEGQRSPPPALGTVTQVSVGEAHVCALAGPKGTSVTCWGATEGADVPARVESASDPRRLNYDDNLFRSVGKNKNLLRCDEQSCHSHTEPVLVFKGLDLVKFLEERYQLYLKINNDCAARGVRVSVGLNNGAPLHEPYATEPSGLTEFRLGLRPEGSIEKLDLSGPAIIHLQTFRDGVATTTLPAGCSLSLRSFTILPDNDTLQKYKGTAAEKAAQLPDTLKEWIESRRTLFFLGQTLEMKRSRLEKRYSDTREILDAMLVRGQDEGLAGLPDDGDAAMALLFKPGHISAFNATGATVEIEVQLPVQDGGSPWLQRLRDLPINAELNDRFVDVTADYAFLVAILQRDIDRTGPSLEQRHRAALEAGFKSAKNLLAVTATLRKLIAQYFVEPNTPEARRVEAPLADIDVSGLQIGKVESDFRTERLRLNTRGENP